MPVTGQVRGDLVPLGSTSHTVGHGPRCRIVATTTKSAKEVGLTEAREVGGNVAVHGPVCKQMQWF